MIIVLVVGIGAVIASFVMFYEARKIRTPYPIGPDWPRYTLSLIYALGACFCFKICGL